MDPQPDLSSPDASGDPSASAPPAQDVPRTTRPGTLLGRLSQAVREQNWFAVALEVLIVIVGVVVGFQISAWGQERDLADREAAQMSALREDFVANREQLTSVIASLKRITSSHREMLRVIHGESPRPAPDSLVVLVNTTFEFRRFEPVLGAYDAMVNAGDVRLLSDPDLRSHLAQFADKAEAGFEDEEQATAIRVGLLTYLAENGDILAVVRPSWRATVGFPTSTMPMDFDSLLSDPEFSSYVTGLAFMEAQVLYFYEGVQKNLDAVLAGLGESPDEAPAGT